MTELKYLIFDYNGVLDLGVENNNQVFEYMASLEGVKVAIFSGMDSGSLKRELADTAAGACIVEYFGIDNMDRLKPSEESFKEVARKLDCEVSKCVMIDDSVRNINGAEAAGMKTVLFGSFDQMKAEIDDLLA